MGPKQNSSIALRSYPFKLKILNLLFFHIYNGRFTSIVLTKTHKAKLNDRKMGIFEFLILMGM